ncbi:putative mitochondrial import receptor subunit tom70 [Psilocybe cubensis]|uniref:Mitochondrial import receptor subunit tom70 n=1 Tax=Psilocybe cubensis TaxID=181762 RepID=A0ACB8H774_PSICU|nr:putative mitochondrial import receptor subunit tom70 [Psilocybe cubensis]KAH9483570.1 putative mitochondrial import receptor subunit tom70 [Psilocybe cubensis]
MDPLEAQAARRVESRKKKTDEKAKQAEELKTLGNESFRSGNYLKAVKYYVEAINVCGPTAVLLSNLSAAFAKANYVEESIWAASTALECDPRFHKARFRRAMARKQLKFYAAAIKGTDRGLPLSAIVRDHPRIEDGPWETYEESDTEDCEHKGNLTPCRFYNHAGCARGSQCQYSHAPDDNSIRDNLGKNVCVELLLGTCKFGDAKCIYSHDTSFLPATGWWNDPSKVQAAREMRNDGDDLDDMFHEGILITDSKISGYTARRRHEIIMSQLYEYYQAIKEESKTPPRTPSQSDRFVLVLVFEYDDLVRSIHSHLLAALRRKIKVVEISNSIDSALQHLAMPNLAAVLVADPIIAKEHRYAGVVSKLVEYVKTGGSVALAGQFSNHISPPQFDRFIKRSFGLDWKFGAYHRTTFKVNPSNELVNRNPSLVATYSMKTVHIADISPDMAIYVPTDGARLQSMVFPAHLIKDTSESPAVCARVGRGLLSFLGDVNGEESSTNTTLAMLGLLDEPNPVVDPPPPDLSSSCNAAGPSNGTNGNPDSRPSSKKKKGKKKKRSNAQANPQNENSGDGMEGRSGYAVLNGNSGNIQLATDFIRGPRSQWGEQTGYAYMSEDDENGGEETSEVKKSSRAVSEQEIVARSGYARVCEEPPKTEVTGAASGTERVAAASRTSGFVLVVALSNYDMFMRIHTEQIEAIKQKAEVKSALTPSQVLEHLKSPDIRGVYIADEGIARPANSQALNEIVQYFKRGGQVVIGGLFPSMTGPPDITKVLSVFGVPWKAGSYTRTLVERNNHHETAARNPSLSEEFSMKAVHLTGFHPEDLFYEQYPQTSNNWEAPVLRTKRGNGHFGYIGDVNAEEESTDIILAMLELLSSKREVVPDSKKFFMILTSMNKDEEYMNRFMGDFIKDAKKKAEVLLGLSNARVIDLLPSRDLLGIFITDPYILNIEHEYLLSKVVEYSKQGGTVVFGCVFSRLVSLSQFRPLFWNNWELDWEMFMGEEDAVVAKNAKNPLASKLDQLKAPNTFQLDGANYVRGITSSMAVYIPQKRQRLWKPADGNFSSSIVYTDVGKGHLGFIGVSIMDENIRAIFYSMIGLI